MSEDNKKLTQIYEELKRRRLVLSKGEFAKKLGYSRAHLHQLMSSDDKVPPDILSKAFGLLAEKPQPLVVKNHSGLLMAAMIRIESKLNILLSNDAVQVAEKTGQESIEVLRKMNKAVSLEVDNLRAELRRTEEQEGL